MGAWARDGERVVMKDVFYRGFTFRGGSSAEGLDEAMAVALAAADAPRSKRHAATGCRRLEDRDRVEHARGSIRCQSTKLIGVRGPSGAYTLLARRRGAGVERRRAVEDDESLAP